METHERAGTVTAVGQHTVTVTFKRSEACGGCAVRNFCHAGNDGENKAEIKVADASSYHVGERVTLTISEKAPSMPPSLPTRCRLPLRLPACSFRLPPAPGKTPPPFPRWRRPLFITCCCFSSAAVSGQKQKLNCDKCKKRFCIPRIYVMYKRIIYKFSRELP